MPLDDQPLMRRIMLARLQAAQQVDLARNRWNDRCTYCGGIHPVHEATRLAPWVRAVAQPSDDLALVRS